MIEFFDPTDAPPPGAFSRATRAGGLVFVAGTGAGNDIGGAPRFGVPTAAKVAFACSSLGSDAARAP